MLDCLFQVYDKGKSRNEMGLELCRCMVKSNTALDCLADEFADELT